MQTEKATAAMYDIIRKGKLHNLSVDCLIDLFDKVVKPILLYGCEVWGFGDNRVIERVHLKFCKTILNLKKSTPDFMIYGELGRYPLEISIKMRIINYWTKLVSGKPEKLPVILYYFAVLKHNIDVPWVNNVKQIFDSCGLSYIWNTHCFTNSSWLYFSTKQKLIDQFRQNWHDTLQTSPKSLKFRLYKDNFEMENYFRTLDDKKIKYLCQFRTLNFKLPIETGRWQGVNRENRVCTICNTRDIGDDFITL